MAVATSKIEWTDYTVNFWWGCTATGVGCDHCYAEPWAKRTGHQVWGHGVPRRKIAGAAATLAKIQRDAPKFIERHGRHPRVFMHSMSDLFDKEVDPAWRAEAFANAELATLCDIQFVTHRISNVAKMVPEHWETGGWPKHIGLLVSVSTQNEAYRDIERLRRLKKRLGVSWIGLSIEPLVEHIELLEADPYAFGTLMVRLANERRPPTDIQLSPEATMGGVLSALGGSTTLASDGIDWVIVGGESGPNARPMHPDWVRSLRDQCAIGSVPFFFKQWGEWIPSSRVTHWLSPNGNYRPVGSGVWASDIGIERIGKKDAGRALDGETHDGFPAVREAA